MGAVGPADSRSKRAVQLACTSAQLLRCARHAGSCSGNSPTPDSSSRWDLNEVLDWTAAALDRVDREAFFDRFNEGEAVPYFYEPFLEEFDPALRKQLGVWYTPTEVVRYMVARVDRRPEGRPRH